MADEKKTVMIFGTFDVVHLGHIAFFHEAKKYGDDLIVVVARDKRSAGIKGKAPIFSEKERAALLEELSVIDRVVLGDKTDVYRVIKHIKPDAIVLGYDQEIFTDGLEEKIKEFGLGTVVMRAKAYKAETYKTKIIKQKLIGDL